MPAIYFTVIPADFATSDQICQPELSNRVRDNRHGVHDLAYCEISRRLIEIESNTARVVSESIRYETIALSSVTITFNVCLKIIIKRYANFMVNKSLFARFSVKTMSKIEPYVSLSFIVIFKIRIDS